VISNLGEVSDAELFDPAADQGRGAFTSVYPGALGGFGVAAVRLDSGQVLFAGGYGSGSSGVKEARLFDPAAGGGLGGFLLLPPMRSARSGAAVALLHDGRVLLAGGYGGAYEALAAAELFVPGSGFQPDAFSPTSSLSEGRMATAGALLPSGRVLVVAGYRLDSSEVFDPLAAGRAGDFLPGPRLTTLRSGALVTALLDGSVLIAGGYNDLAGPIMLTASAERYRE
jgi:hypothetical protein